MPAGGQHPAGMLARLRNWWESPWGTRAVGNGYEVALVTTLMIGVFLRVSGWLGHHISFWMDEALWASRLLKWPLLELGIRPVGFMGITRLVVQLFGATEVWFRLLPALGALGSLLLMPYVASQLVTSKWLRLLMVLMFAIHPALVDYANEFKPYSWEVLVHLVPIALYLRFKETGRRAWFYSLLGFLPVSFLLAYNMALAFPGLLLLCLAIAWKSPDKKKLVIATVLSGTLCAAGALTIFELALSNVTKEERTESYWGKKYDVFYEKTESLPRFDWTLQKFGDLASFISIRSQFWTLSPKISERNAAELAAADRLFWVSLSYAGLWALWKKRRDLLMVYATPMLVMVLGNFIGKWPLGAFRVNLFTLVYLLPLPFLGMQLLAEADRRMTWVTGSLAMALTIIPGFRFGFDWHGHKRTFTRDFYQREVMAKLYEYRKQQLAKDPNLPRARLLLEPHTWYPNEFYLHDQPDFKAKYEQFFANNFIIERASGGTLNNKLPQRLRRGGPAQGIWLVSSARREFDNLKRGAERGTTIVIQEQIENEHLIMYVEPKVDAE